MSSKSILVILSYTSSNLGHFSRHLVFCVGSQVTTLTNSVISINHWCQRPHVALFNSAQILRSDHHIPLTYTMSVKIDMNLFPLFLALSPSHMVTWNKTEIKQNCRRSAALFNCSFISDVRTSLKLKHWNSFAVLKNMPMRLKQFRVLFLFFISPCATDLRCCRSVSRDDRNVAPSSRGGKLVSKWVSFCIRKCK